MQHDARLRSLTRNPPFRRGGQCPTTFVEHPSRCPHRQDKVAACPFARLTKTLFLIWECKTRTKTPFWTTSIPRLPTLGVCAISFFFCFINRAEVQWCTAAATGLQTAQDRSVREPKSKRELRWHSSRDTDNLAVRHSRWPSPGFIEKSTTGRRKNITYQKTTQTFSLSVPVSTTTRLSVSINMANRKKSHNPTPPPLLPPQQRYRWHSPFF